MYCSRVLWYYGIMYLAILFIMSLKTGETVFSRHEYVFSYEYDCQIELTAVQELYGEDFFIRGACIEVPNNQEI